RDSPPRTRPACGRRPAGTACRTKPPAPAPGGYWSYAILSLAGGRPDRGADAAERRVLDGSLGPHCMHLLRAVRARAPLTGPPHRRTVPASAAVRPPRGEGARPCPSLDPPSPP